VRAGGGGYAIVLGDGARVIVESTLVLGADAKSIIGNSVVLGNGSAISSFVPTSTVVVCSCVCGGFAGAVGGLGGGVVLFVGFVGGGCWVWGVVVGCVFVFCLLWVLGGVW
ncbi:hypothetical protein ACTHT5_11355, partial [Neisseria sp. P0022.S002]|uniref:hypothetical protein n=1 Tax=Neisseria sp. P0022.S002 TaxID=3436827 RepID=UPI003F7DEC81